MSAQVLSDRSTRRIAADVGADVIRVLARGGYVHQFVTSDHRHGWYDVATRAHGYHPAEGTIHWSSCLEMWPEQIRTDRAGHQLFPGQRCPALTCRADWDQP